MTRHREIRPSDAAPRAMRGALAALLAVAALALSGCEGGRGGPRGFHPAIDCQGPFIAPDFRARCGPYRNRGRD